MDRTYRALSPLLMLLALTGVNCGKDTTSTLVGPAPISSAPVVKVSIGGNLAPTSIGETTQLKAIATLSDGTTKDIASDGQWRWGDTRVITLSQGGLATVKDFGATWVSFNYQTRLSASATLRATPEGTFMIFGYVREPGAGALANAGVVDALTGRSTATNTDGYFSLAELPRLEARLRVERENYEPSEVNVTTENPDLPLQRIVRITAGETVVPGALAPHDLSYEVEGVRCSPCRLIRVVVPQAGTVHVRVSWTASLGKLSLFAEGQVVAGGPGELIADVPVSAPREVLMYLGTRPPDTVTQHTSFKFETLLQ